MTLRQEFDKIHVALDTIKEVQIQQAENIKHHISRTDALEKMLLPVYRLYLQCLGIVKGLAVLASLGGCLWILKLIFKF
jgi:hypothetical protein